jgi:hypothetical protein
LKEEIVSREFIKDVGGVDYWKRMKEVAEEAFKHLLKCGDGKLETGFRIDINDKILTAYTGSDVISGQKNGEVTIRVENNTVAIGHNHPLEKEKYSERYAKPYEFSPDDKSHGLPNFLATPEEKNSDSYKFQLWKPKDKKNGTNLGLFEVDSSGCIKRRHRVWP